MRIKELDLIKWLAFGFMVLDHLRFLDLIDEAKYPIFVFGRLAFPLFCFLMAYNFFRTDGLVNTLKSDQRYISSLLIFFIISEIPYRLYGDMKFTSMNIMLTLAFSFILLYSYTRKNKVLLLEPSLITLLVVLTCLGFEYTDLFKVQYGLAGVFLPVAMYFCLKHNKPLNWFFVILCAAIMNFFWENGMMFNGISSFIMICIPMFVSILGALLGFAIIQTKISIQVPPITKWGYWFYPVHLTVLFILRYIWRIYS